MTAHRKTVLNVHFNVPRNFQTLRRELKIHCTTRSGVFLSTYNFNAMSYKNNTFLPVLFGSLLLAGFCSL